MDKKGRVYKRWSTGRRRARKNTQKTNASKAKA